MLLILPNKDSATDMLHLCPALSMAELSKWFPVGSSEYSAIDNSWQLPNGAITVITEELAKHESRVLQPDIFKAKCNFPTKYIILEKM